MASTYPSSALLCLIFFSSLAAPQPSPSSQVLQGSVSGYLSDAEVRSFFATLHRDHPSLVSAPVSLGKSLEGREIVGVCAGHCAAAAAAAAATPSVPPLAAASSCLNALIHAREPMSMEGLVYFAEWLVDTAQEPSRAGDEARMLLRSRDIWFLPVLNPDAYVANAAAAAGRSGRMQRKNMRKTCDVPACHGLNKAECTAGVDLNRNFPVCFKQDEEGSSSDGCRGDYRGTAPFSEPETQVMRAFVDAHAAATKKASGPRGYADAALPPPLSIVLNWHSFGRYINIPWMCKHQMGEEAAPGPGMRFYTHFGDEAKAQAGMQKWQSGRPWETRFLYSVNGDASDWMAHAHDILAVSPEVGPECVGCPTLSDSDGFWPTREKIRDLAREALPLNLEAVRMSAAWLWLKSVSVTEEVEGGSNSGDSDPATVAAAAAGKTETTTPEKEQTVSVVRAVLRNAGLRPTRGDLRIAVVTQLQLQPTQDGGAMPASVPMPRFARVEASSHAQFLLPSLGRGEESPDLTFRATVSDGNAGSTFLVAQDDDACVLFPVASGGDATVQSRQAWRASSGTGLCGALLCRADDEAWQRDRSSSGDVLRPGNCSSLPSGDRISGGAIRDGWGSGSGQEADRYARFTFSANQGSFAFALFLVGLFVVLAGWRVLFRVAKRTEAQRYRGRYHTAAAGEGDSEAQRGLAHEHVAVAEEADSSGGGGGITPPAAETEIELGNMGGKRGGSAASSARSNHINMARRRSLSPQPQHHRHQDGRGGAV